MEHFTFLLLLLLVWLTIHALLSQLLKSSKLKARKLPPGPFPFPIIGNLFQLGNEPHKSLAELAKTHGPLMTLQLGQVTTVIITSADMAKEVLQKYDLYFCNRTVVDAARALKHHEFSSCWMPVSAPWRNLRKICNTQIFSSSRLDVSQHLRRKKTEDLVSYVEKCAMEGVAVDIGQAAFSINLNLLSTMFFSVDLSEPGSDMVREFKEIVTEIMEESGKPNFADYFPVLKGLDLQGIRRRVQVHYGKIINLFNMIIDQRLLTRRSGSNEVNDVLDELLNMNKENGEELERPYIIHLLLDLLLGGTDTTSSTIEWAMAELLHNPDKLEQAQVELKQVIGRGNLLKEGDIARLPYLQSIVKETLRLHPPLPFLLPRKVDNDVELCGFVVPKNVQVLVNAWAIARDPNIWKNPNSFEPERFLESEIDVKGQNFELTPFGAGRRICPGMPLALRMLPLILGSLINSFNWKAENGAKPASINMEAKFGITLHKSQHLTLGSLIHSFNRAKVSDSNEE